MHTFKAEYILLFLLSHSRLIAIVLIRFFLVCYPISVFLIYFYVFPEDFSIILLFRISDNFLRISEWTLCITNLNFTNQDVQIKLGASSERAYQIVKPNIKNAGIVTLLQVG